MVESNNEEERLARMEQMLESCRDNASRDNGTR
jgi:hypothetical protein